MAHRRTPPRRRRGPDDGALSVYVAICAAALVVLVGIVLDLGGRLRAIERADARAQEAARVASQQLDVDAVLQGRGYRIVSQEAAERAADDYLQAYNLTGTTRLVDDHTVEVRTTGTYTSALIGAVLPDFTHLEVHGYGKATLVHGITEAENG
ncbi:hypothetical protein [Streptomyces sp. NRRL B-24484]|uniref:hypothetical protein n=1 Tax=Streptomyces sp. NRRL B-24484 TaxID=1463833 RepID=UPI000693D72B|nr:hypothetical protein [Streptomyces sp. NRRL B-24484]